jgi:glycosyltransferase involved in cell wall biosynthesis
MKPLVTVVDLVTSVGGTQKVMADLLPRLGEQFRVTIIDAYCHPNYARLFPPAVIDQVSLGDAPERRFIGGSGPVERARKLAERGPWLVATGLRLRKWVERRRPAVIYFNQLPTLSFLSRFLPASGPRIVYHAHGFSSAADIRDGRRLGRICARILAVSHSVATVMVDAGVSRSTISVVHNGIDPERVRQRARAASAPLPARDPDEVIIAHVGVLSAHKQQHVAIEALARLPKQVTLWICGGVPEGGDPSYAQRLRGQAARLGISSRVRFLGWRDDVPSVLAAADVAVLPSREESFGLALAEAMALGKPCVGTAIGGIPEVIEHGITGFVTPSDPGAVAEALSQLVASTDARRKMGAAGQQRVERLFTVERQAREVRAALDAVLAETGTGPTRGAAVLVGDGRAPSEVGR